MKLKRFALVGLGVVVVVIAIVWAAGRRSANRHQPATITARPPSTISSLPELLALSPPELGHVEIARVNLLCAQGLPSAEHLDIGSSLAAIDQMAARVRSETERTPKIVRYHRLN